VEQAVALATTAYELALQGYRSGITEFLNVITTESALLRDRQQVAAIQAKRLDSCALLMQALGGGLESRTAEMSDLVPGRDDHHAP
jgi:outer membrane protein TolC